MFYYVKEKSFCDTFLHWFCDGPFFYISSGIFIYWLYIGLYIKVYEI